MSTQSFPDWNPFVLAPAGDHGDRSRALTSIEGIGDRLRSAAFAEIQARDAFRWAAERFTDAPEELRKAWLLLAKEEQKHLDWLLNRMKELNIPVGDRRVSTHLWISLTACTSAKEFALFMASAEERGRVAGVRFYEALREIDATSARIFQTIAQEEISHIELAKKFFVA